MAASAASRRNVIHRLMQQVTHHTACPCHSCQAAGSAFDASNAARAIMSKGRARSYAKAVNEGSTDYAYEVSASNLRFGEGVTVRSYMSRKRDLVMSFADRSDALARVRVGRHVKTSVKWEWTLPT